MIRAFLIFLGIILSCFSHALAQEADVWEVLRHEFMINHEINRPEVQEQIRWLLAHPGYLNKVGRQSEPYIYHIVTEIKKRRLPGELALLPIIESAFDPFAYSGAGAAGLWQLMPKTGSGLGLKQDWWFDGRRSIGPSTDAALNYLVYLHKFFNSHWILAIAAYDAGEGTVDRAIKASMRPGYLPDFWSLPVPQETKVYVPRLFALAEIIKNPDYYHITLPFIPYLPYFEEVNIGSQIDLSHAAKLAGISYKELIKLNPGYNRWTTAPYKPFKLLIPAEKVELFNLNLSNVPEKQRVSWTKHRVQRSNHVNNTAVRYHSTANLIKKMNQLPHNTIRPNQPIIIPSAPNTEIIAKNTEPTASMPLVKPLHHRVIHIVQMSDSYQKIEHMYGVTLKEIQIWNKLSIHQALHPGQALVIWKKEQQAIPYIVQSGDTLNAIARTCRTNVAHIIALNPGMTPTTTLRLGQKIWVG